ncbi:MAG: response regulator [Bdellovibrionales bacterium]|nr:response regulator [Bdellovibrionales bacterium]
MKRFRILIAEDEEMLLDLFEMLISGEIDCDIITASNGEVAMEILNKDHNFQLIISDYKMPKMNGGELFHFNLKNFNIPFFLFSGGELEDYPELNQFKASNPKNRFFNKPFSEKTLISEIKRLAA